MTIKLFGTCVEDFALNFTRLAKLPRVKLRVIGEGIDKIAEFARIKVGDRHVYAGLRTGSLYDCTSGECLSSSRLRVMVPA